MEMLPEMLVALDTCVALRAVNSESVTVATSGQPFSIAGGIIEESNEDTDEDEDGDGDGDGDEDGDEDEGEGEDEDEDASSEVSEGEDLRVSTIFLSVF
jgi:hypothetical protein